MKTLRLHDGYDDTSPDLHDDVKQLQRLLTSAGYDVTSDGFFGPGTEAMVEKFQRDHGLDADGIVGPKTWAKLQGGAAPDSHSFLTLELLPTTFASTDPGRLAENAVAVGYEGAIESAAKRYGIPSCIICGIASRESGFGLMLKPKGPSGTGDFTPRAPKLPFRAGTLPIDGGGFGRGIMQIDYDASVFARSNGWKDPVANLTYGAGVLRGNIDYLAPRIDEKLLLKAAVSAYNCGAGNVLKAIEKKLDLDYFTSGRNYAKDVLDRAGWFQRLGWG